MDGASSRARSRPISPSSPNCTRPASSKTTIVGACQGRRQDRARPGAGRRQAAHAGRGQRRHGGAGARSGPHSPRHQEPGRNPGRARRAPPRRRGGGEAAVLAGRAEAGHARRDRRRDQAGRDAAGRPARKPRCRCATSPSTRSPAPARTARSCTTASRAPPTASLRDGELFLLDSGAQYQDGTTDITRTVPIGQPTEEMRERFTLVLKGMIGISMLRFPAGTRGCDIDAVARHGAVEARLRLRPRHRPRRRLLSRRA